MWYLKWERIPVSAKNVEKTAVVPHHLIHVSRVTVQVNHLNVISVGMPLFKALPIDKPILLRMERKHLNVMNVGKPLEKVLT